MNRRLLYLFPNQATARIAEVEQGLIPSERLYGLLELRERGWKAEISDARWVGPFATLRRRLKRFIELPSLGTLGDMRRADIVVVKDSFSTTLLTQARLAGKPLVYLDAMFEPPHNGRNRAMAYNLTHAHTVCCYSRHQADEWAKAFGLSDSHFEIMPYCIDCDFYPQLERRLSDAPYVLSVGRDLGRDFDTLIQACEELGIALKLVTLPYLLPENAQSSKHVEVLQNLSYPDLFDLYAGAAMAVIPLKAGITYPSGIRAMLESAALGVPTVVSETAVLPEYLQDHEHVRYALAEDVGSLVNAMRTTLDDSAGSQEMATRGSREVREKFSTEQFANMFEQVISRI